MPPPDGPGEVDLRVPQAAGHETFAAFIFFTVLGPLAAPGNGATSSLADFSLGATSTPTAPVGKSGKLAAGSPSSPTSGALGATKTLRPAVVAPSGTNWWLYAAIGATLLTLLLLASLLLGRRRRLAG